MRYGINKQPNYDAPQVSGHKSDSICPKIGVTSQLINKIEAGNAKLSEANLRITCFTFKVNETWLREGKGEMLDEEAMLSDFEKRILDLFKRLSPTARKFLIEYAEKLASDETALRVYADAEFGEQQEKRA